MCVYAQYFSAALCVHVLYIRVYLCKYVGTYIYKSLIPGVFVHISQSGSGILIE